MRHVLLLQCTQWALHSQTTFILCTYKRLTSRETKPQMSSGIFVSWLVARLSSTMLVHVPKSNGRDVNWLSWRRQWQSLIKMSATRTVSWTSALWPPCYLARENNVSSGEPNYFQYAVMFTSGFRPIQTSTESDIVLNNSCSVKINIGVNTRFFDTVLHHGVEFKQHNWHLRCTMRCNYPCIACECSISCQHVLHYFSSLW